MDDAPSLLLFNTTIDDGIGLGMLTVVGGDTILAIIDDGAASGLVTIIDDGTATGLLTIIEDGAADGLLIVIEDGTMGGGTVLGVLTIDEDGIVMLLFKGGSAGAVDDDEDDERERSGSPFTCALVGSKITRKRARLTLPELSGSCKALPGWFTFRQHWAKHFSMSSRSH